MSQRLSLVENVNNTRIGVATGVKNALVGKVLSRGPQALSRSMRA